ncbi:MAG: DUF4363 family protein [Oscillospiraceae bacterium]|nr:DUF4363 family protein [Oscillospiraceae bacterium]
MSNKRIRTALAVLLMLVLLMICSVVTVRHCCGRLLRGTDLVLESLDSQQENAVSDAIEALEANWRRYSIPLHLFVPNQPLTDLNKSVFRLGAMQKDGCDELRAELCAVKADLEWIRGQEMTLF